MPSFSCKVRSKQLSVNPDLTVTDSVEELISQRVQKLKQELAQGVQKPFKEVIDATSGDSSSCGQKPITFIRQVSAVSCLPELLEDSTLHQDVKSRAQLFLQHHARDNTGIEVVRRHVADFLHRRDNCPVDHNNIILVPGLSASVKMIRKLMSLHSHDGALGVLAPVPQFLPLSNLFLDQGIQLVQYPLIEDHDWSIDINELENSFSAGKTVCDPRAILIVNPGYPTGHILSRTNIEDIIRFAAREKLLIVAFEIYQGAVHDEYTFISFKKALFEMDDSCSEVELISIMLYSGDFTNEPGFQNGFMEFYNVEEQTMNYIKGSIATCDSSPLCSQVALDCMVNPPQPEEPSYALFCRDADTLQTYVGVMARIVYNHISSTPGLSCSPVQAGHCAFVKINMPPKAVDSAKSMGLCPSTFYVLDMLEHSGVVTVPAKLYGQMSGSYYFMLSFLMSEDKLKKVLSRIRGFHLEFTKMYQ